MKKQYTTIDIRVVYVTNDIIATSDSVNSIGKNWSTTTQESLDEDAEVLAPTRGGRW